MKKRIQNHPFFRKSHQELLDRLAEELGCDIEVFFDKATINNKKKLEAIVTVVLAVFGVSAAELKIKSSRRLVADARRAIVYIALKHEYATTDKRIGVLVHRDRSTVSGLKHNAQDLYNTDLKFAKMIDKCIKELGYERNNNEV